MKESPSLSDLADAPALSEWLAARCSARDGPRTVVGVAVGNRSVFATSGSNPSAESAADVFIPCGCIAKSLTAALVMVHVRAGHLKLDSFLSGLDGVRLRHLLNHTHGLDASELTSVPLNSAGFIDVASLIDATRRAGRVAEAGTLYSYGSTGSWWAAAVLEQQFRVPYRALLQQNLLDALGMRFQESDEPICPARGGSLRLSLDAFLVFLRWQLHTHRSGDLDSGAMPGPAVALPGPALERGTGLGWHSYGDGWFGHNAIMPSESVCLRFNAERQIAIVVAAESRSAALTLARVFGKELPEFRHYVVPRPLRDRTRSAWDGARCAGTYRSGALAIDVSPEFPPTIVIRTLNDSLDGCPPRMIHSTLQPCTQDLFLLEPAALSACGSWIQFIRPSVRGFEYIWNGSMLLPRAA